MRNILFAALALTVACGDGPTNRGGPTVDLIGTYVLTSVDGHGLPAEIARDGDRVLYLSSASITFHAGGRFGEVVTLSYTEPGQAPSSNASAYVGDYLGDGDERYVALVYRGTESDVAAIAGTIVERTDRQLVRQFEGPELIFAKP